MTGMPLLAVLCSVVWVSGELPVANAPQGAMLEYRVSWCPEKDGWKQRVVVEERLWVGSKAWPWAISTWAAWPFPDETEQVELFESYDSYESPPGP